MKTFAAILVLLSLLLGQFTPALTQGLDSETPTPTKIAAEESATATDIPTLPATSTSIPSTGTPTTETPVTQTTPTAPVTETATSTATPTLTATPGAASALTLSLTSTPGFISAGGNVTIHWEIIGLKKAQISDLTLKVLLPEGVEPDGNSKKESFDETSRILSFAVEKLQGQFQLQTDKGSEGILLSAELVKGEETQATAELLIPQKETFDVKQNGGSIRALNNKLKVTIPAGALPEDATIDIGFPTKDSTPEYSLSGRPFEIKAHGKSNKSEIREFGKEIEFEAQYGDLSISEPDEQYLQLYWYDPETKEWVILPSWVDKENKVVHGLTTHFSVFDIGVNNWNASRLPTIDAFQVSTFTGAATYSLPIETPPGPGGFQPDLTLSYNSQVIDQATIQTQASWVGMGWSLGGGGSIFPNQDGGYILSVGGIGTVLRRESVSGPWHANDENFWRITTVNGWEVYDKQGNTYYFQEAATGYSAGNPVHAETLGWYLTKARNIHGQEINYAYEKQTKVIISNPNGNTPYSSVTAVYLDTITYGRTRIRFVREARTDYTAAWDTDAGIHLFEKERLRDIYVERDDNKNDIFEPAESKRSYQLNYAAPTDTDQIWPNIYYTAGGKVSTLRSVTQYGTDNVNHLPAVTFTYEGNLHLTKAENGYGGRVDFVYDTTPYFATTPRPSYDLRTDFCHGLGKNGWTGGISCQSEGHEKWTDVYGTATTTLYDPNLTKPGGAYYLDAGLLSGTLSVGLFNGLENQIDQMVTSGAAVIILSPAANNADPIMSSPSYGTIGSFHYRLLSSFYRVTQKIVHDGNGYAYPFNYSYTGAAVSPLGAWCAPPPNAWSCVTDAEAYSEFRGHSSVTETGPDGRTTVTNYYQDEILKGRISSVTVYSPSWAPLTQSIYTYTSTALPVFFSTGWIFNGYGHFWVRQTSQENRIYANNGTYSATLASYTYDPTNGNQLTQTDASWNGSSWTNYRATSTDYLPNTGTPYLVGLPVRQALNAGLNLQTLLDETLYLYDSDGKLTAVRRLMNTGQYAQTSYGYDEWGNQTSVTNYTGYGSASSAQTTSSVYDPTYHAYPISITNAEGQTTLLDYDYVKGVPKCESELLASVPVGRTCGSSPNDTTAEYDSFGRLTSLTRPLDAVGAPSLTIQYIEPNPVLPLFTTLITQKIDASTNYTLMRKYDGMGREIQTNAGGILTDMIYDAYGRVISQSTPHASNETPDYTTMSYDVLGRPVTVSAPDGSVTSYSYDGLVSALKDPNGYTTITTNDVWGRTLSVVPPTGPSVSYDSYDAKGQLQSVTRGGATTYMTYTYGGQKSTMTDPDMGNWKYTYDALGNLKTQTDARSCVLTINYDLLNRPINKSSSGSGCGQQTGVITYIYDDTTDGNKGIGHRTSMDDASGSTSWTYDARGRMTSEAKTITGLPIQYTYWTYNLADLPITTTYPDGEVVTNTYDNRMLLYSVIGNSGSSAYLSSTTYDSAGRTTARALGNGLTQDFTYYEEDTPAQGGRLQSLLTGTLQNLNYTYRADGNIMRIRDNVAVEANIYTYDSLDRLTDWNSTSSMDETHPVVTSITRKDPNPTNASSLGFIVTFSEPVTGVDTNAPFYDFALTTTNITGASITGVSGSGTTYTVTVNSGVGNGTIRLDVPSSADIIDLSGNPLANLPFTNGASYSLSLITRWTTDFTSGQGWMVSQNPRMVGDVNGDGKDDLIGFGNDGVYIAISTGSGFSTISKWITAFSYSQGWRVDQHPRMAGDVNGDGKDDLIGFGVDGVYVAISTGSGFYPITRWTTDFTSGQGWMVSQNPRMVGDVNGDGKDDLIGFGNDGVYVAISTGSGFSAISKWITAFGYAQGWRVDQHPRMAGDVNGDGKDDLVGFGVDGVWVAISTVNGFSPISKWTTDFTYSGQGWVVDQHPRMVGDVNGDGKDDLVGFGIDGVYIAISTGSVFSAMSQWITYFGYSQGWRVDQHPRVVGDASGDGKDDLVGFGIDGVYVNVSTLLPPTLPPANNGSEKYAYDPATGNLSSKDGVTYTYDTTHKHAVASLSNGNTYGYDANGNQTTRVISGQTYTLGYDAENRLVSVSGPSAFSASFVYDGDGKQVKSTINGVTTYFVGAHYQIVGGVVSKYYFAGASRIAMRTNETLYYLLSDHLGSTSLTTNSSGSLVSETRYTAWGETRFTSGATPTSYKYTSQREESSFGLYFYNARWYDPALSRFTQADSIVPGGVQGWDRYAYVSNNPVRYTDPTGHNEDCGLGEQYCHAGKLDVGKRALDLADHYKYNAEHGAVLTWNGLSEENRSILLEGGWTEGAYLDHISGGVSDADFWHDPLSYAEMAVGGAGLLKAGYGLAVSYATINSGASVVSIGSYGLYQKPGFTYFQLPDKVYTALSKVGIGQYNLANLVNRGVISSQRALGKPVIVNLANINKPGPGTVMELKMYENAGYIRGSGNFMNSDFVLQIATWLTEQKR